MRVAGADQGAPLQRRREAVGDLADGVTGMRTRGASSKGRYCLKRISLGSTVAASWRRNSASKAACRALSDPGSHASADGVFGKDTSQTYRITMPAERCCRASCGRIWGCPLCVPKIGFGVDAGNKRSKLLSLMTDLFWLILGILASLVKTRAELEAENLVLRQQINVLRRRKPKRPTLTNVDRLLFVWLYCWFPSTAGALAIVRPETIIRWHRAGFRSYWRWRSRNRVGRPKVSAELRALIGEMSQANPLWGAPRIHGELLKLGFEVAQSTVAKYMVRRRGPPSQGWKTFLRNHGPDIGSVDMFVVPTIGFRLLYGLAIIRLGRRHLVWINVTANPTADWIARQITEAFPWDDAPRYLIRDRDPHMATP